MSMTSAAAGGLAFTIFAMGIIGTLPFETAASNAACAAAGLILASGWWFGAIWAFSVSIVRDSESKHYRKPPQL